MLILPIVNRNRILNVEVKLKTADKIRTGVKFSDACESDVIVNGQRFSDSSYRNEKSDKAALEFIRTSSIRYKRNYLITTREVDSTALYDVYEVEQPPRKVNDALDNLYVSAITDMRKEIPGNKRGRYLSLDKLGIGDILTDEKIETLGVVVRNTGNPEELNSMLSKTGISDLVDTIDFLKLFDCTVVEDTTIAEETLQGMVDSLKKLNTREARNLASYYNMALKNRDIYSKLSTINKMVYGKPLTLIQSKRQKQLVKAMGDSSNAA
jgi:hypothetical protein